MNTFAIKLSTALLALALASSATSARAEPDKKTVRLWKAKCAACHGAEGKGDTEKGQKMGVADLTAAAWQTEMTDAKMKEAIGKGLKREKNGKKQEMEAYKDKLQPAEIDTLIGFMRSLKK